mmetsp:Transcript_164/g.250  ORF Transcript_164/g.250 Transcript_164/m.250 type:complete len:393 (-) Transcript_164:158-1336(-)
MPRRGVVGLAVFAGCYYGLGRTFAGSSLPRNQQHLAGAPSSASVSERGIDGWSTGGRPRRGLRGSAGGVQRRSFMDMWDGLLNDPTMQYMLDDPIIRVCGWSFLIFSCVVMRVATAVDEAFTPKTYLQESLNGDGTGFSRKISSSDGTIVCLGDSLTRGNLSADWVSYLRDHSSVDGRVVLNAGVNMQCIENVKARLDEVIACKPSHVTVLVGTNDMKASMSPLEGVLYLAFGKLQKVATLEDYAADLKLIRDRLLEAGACVALVSPPVLGEDKKSAANVRAAAYATTVKRVAEEGGERCTYLPLFELTADALPQDGGKSYCGFQFFLWVCGLCWDIHVMRRDLAEVQRERKLGVTVDLVHLGPTAASGLAEMTAAFVESFPAGGRFSLSAR